MRKLSVLLVICLMFTVAFPGVTPALVASPAADDPPQWLDSSAEDFLAGQLNGLDAISDPGNLRLEEPAWRAGPELPGSRASAMAVTDGAGRVHVLGGIGSSGVPLAAHDVFDPETGLWESKAPWPNARGNVAAALGQNGKIYLIGGAQFGTSIGLAEAYDPASDSWELLAPMTNRTTGAGVVCIGGKLYVLGLAGTVGTRVQSFDPVTNSWAYLAGNANRRGGYGVAAVGSKIYVIGGFDQNGKITGILEAFDTTSNAWTTLAPMPSARSYMAVSADRAGRLWVSGGQNSTQTDKVEVYDPATDTWRAGPSLTEARSGAAGTLMGDKLLVLGGLNQLFAPTRSFLSLDVEPDGSIVSRLFDAGDTVDWKVLSWTATVPDATALAVATRSSNDATNWSDWSAPATTSGLPVASPPGRYLQYRAELASATPWDGPVLSDITVSYQITKPKAPIPLSPLDGAELMISAPSFSWDSGQSGAGAYSFVLQLDTSPSFDSSNLRSFEGIPEGEASTSFTLPPDGPLTDGSWYWRVAADDGSRRSDWSEVRGFAVDTRPDIEVSPGAVTIDTNPVAEPDTAMIEATVRNLGADSSEFTVSLYDGDPLSGGIFIGSRQVAGLAAGAETSVSLEYDSYGNEGNHRLYVVADSESSLSERSEENNKASTDIFVAPHGLALDMTASATSLGAEETLTIDTLVTNGGIVSRDTYLKIFVIDKEGVIVGATSEALLSGITPGDVRAHSFEWSTGRTYAGDYRVRAELTVAGHVLDSSERQLTIEPTPKSRSRVLVWAKTKAQAELAESALDRAGADYRVIHQRKGDNDHPGEHEFARSMRSGIFNQYWMMGGSHPLEGHVGRELTKKVDAGAVLLVLGDKALHKMADELEPGGDNVLGLKVKGTLPRSQYKAQLLGSVVSDSGTVEVSGKAADLKLTTAQSLGAITIAKGLKQSTHSIIALNNYGLGTALTVGFDVDGAPTLTEDILARLAALPPEYPNP